MDDSKLTHAAKAEIRRYLLRISLPTGGIVGVLLLGLGWAVNELGVGLAHTKAFESAQSLILATTSRIGSAEADAKRARMETERAQEAAEAASSAVLKIKKDLDIAKVSSIVGDAAEKLSNDSNFVNLVLQKTSADWKEVTEKLNGAGEEWGVARGEHGYGFQAWKHQNKSVHCPKGSYVTGIRVRYSGTCNTKCDNDGGIVREIVLTCRTVFP